MKIGVLTLPLHTNFGGNLQAYALVSALKEMGHDAWLIKWEKDRTPLWKSPLTIAKRLVQKYALGKKGIVIGSGIFDRRKRDALEVHAKYFINRRITPQTSGFRSTRALARRIGDYRFDAIVVGSDQVWRPAPNVEDYFLGFLNESAGTTRRVAYAASFGTDQWTFSTGQHQACKRHIAKFDAISVREDSGVTMCRDYFDTHAEHVIDPTMLLPRSHYVDLARTEDSMERTCKGKGLFVYVLDANVDKAVAADHIAECLGLSQFSVTVPSKDSSASLGLVAVPPVEDWLRSFEKADFVFTDSFHGCVFSIIFNKPFIAYGNKNRGLCRFESLLRMFHLEDRLVDSAAVVSSDIIFRPIDWQAVNGILATRQTEAVSFLNAAICGGSQTKTNPVDDARLKLSST